MPEIFVSCTKQSSHILCGIVCYTLFMKAKELNKILEDIEFLYEKYSLTLRSSTQPYHLLQAQKNFANEQFHPDHDLVREPLIEHVGSLPVLATTLYPYTSDPEVVLGDALTMLAIDDIGELKTGDEMTFTKKGDKSKEIAAALSLLDESYHNIYKRSKELKTKSAKFAKSIDKIAPDILDYLTPKEATIWRYETYTGRKTPDEIIQLIKSHKRPFMLWNDFMAEFHVFLLGKLHEKLSS